MNKFEKQIGELSKSIILDLIPRNSISVKADKAIKLYDKGNKLFIQSRSPYQTPTGLQKRSDLSLYCPMYGIDWRIECKSRENAYDLLGEITRELNFVADIPEKLYCLVMTDNLLTTYFLNELNQIVREKGLEDKVWIGNKKKFKKLIKKYVKLSKV